MAEAFSVVVDKDVPLPVRDGTVLRADVYRPAVEGRWPVLLGRTCYGKDSWGGWIDPLRTAGQGYAVVINDTRGSFASGGEFHPFVHDADDGYDVVEWCAAQPWSDGKVGMFGSSAPGYLQLLAAVAGPPHLVAIAPMQTWWSFGRGGVYDADGAFTHYSQEWALLQATIDPAKRLDAERPGFADRRQAVARAMWEKARWFRHLPLSELPPLPREVSEYYYRWLEHPDDDEYWRPMDVRPSYGRIGVPALHLVGWFDRLCRTTIDNYLGIMREGATAAAREHQRLVVGPWPHGLPVITECGDEHFGPRGSVDVRALVLRWYDHWLKGTDTGMLDEPPVRLFVHGEDAWRDEPSWPPPGARSVAWYLHSAGRANGLEGDGRLSLDPPGGEPADSYVHDPADPVPSTPGRVERPRGAVDQRAVERREDVLVFTSAPLEEDVEVVGPVSARLWATSSAVDTDWMVKLVDVRPDGYARPLSHGMVRARYRESQSAPKLLEPWALYEYVITLLPVANRFRAGHRIRVEVASSSFPAFDRNLGTGNPLGADHAGVTAIQFVHHDAEHPSQVVLSVVPARREPADAR